MIITIVFIYAFLIGLLVFYQVNDSNSEKKLTNKVNELETVLNEYYTNEYNRDDLGKLFIFPGENTIVFDEDNLIGEAFIYSDGAIEIALYDGKKCAYKKSNTEISITEISIKDCVVNR